VLDYVLSTRAGDTREEVLLQYLIDLPSTRSLSQLVQAEMAYLFFSGHERPMLYTGDTELWQVHDMTWKPATGNLSRVKALVQSDFLYALRAARQRAADCNAFPARSEGATHPRLEFLEKMTASVECEQPVNKIIREAAIFCEKPVVFDENPWLFQLQNCVLDIRTNTFRQSKPSDMCKRSSPIKFPESWLKDPTLMEVEAPEKCDDAWDTLWTLYGKVRHL